MPFPTPLRGVVPPVVTPLTPSGDVDVPSLRRLVGHLTGAGVHALFVLGSSGEASHLTDAQRMTVLDTVVEEASGKLPVLAGVIDMSTQRVLERAADAVKGGADAVVVTAPFYARTHPAEITRHFRAVREGAGVPVVAYDIPSHVHTRLPRETVLGLAAEGTLAGLKDSSGDDGSLRRLLVEVRRSALEFTVLTGSELTVDGALLAGADGVVPGLGNVDPHGYVRLYEAARAGDWAAARAEQDRLVALFALVEAGDPMAMGPGSSALGAFKAALGMLGVIDCAVTAAPQVPLDEDALTTVGRRLAEAGLR